MAPRPLAQAAGLWRGALERAHRRLPPAAPAPPQLDSQRGGGGAPPARGAEVESTTMKGVVLAAGEGRRLRPLTELLPKPLCPVANRPLFDIALERVRTVADLVAANVH